MVGERLGPYEIISAIGSGGMGEVWKARDTRLGRIVAIKKVKEKHSERFLREARSIAALNHPNICQIHDIGPDYLVLEYVEGKPLPNPLPEQEAVRLGIQIAAALEAAHRKGIIHRDLKPANIMITGEGAVKLLDFGLAKLYEQDAHLSTLPTKDLSATQAGTILGTVAYMSPEQVQGQPADGRSDIFSLGLVLYEMLSGKRAFHGDSASETIAALLRDEPAPLRTSPELEKVVKRCLERNPADRYQAMTEVRKALENTAEEKTPGLKAEPQPSIAVLPFVNMSGDKDQEYFSDGLAEEIITALTKIPGLKVIARTSAFAFKGKNEDIRKIADVLGVVNILEGSVRKSGKRIRVTAQLVTASDGSHLWSERFDREMTDVFEIQDEICQAIVDKLRVKLAPNQAIVKRYTENAEAYNLLLKGRYHFFKLTPQSLGKSKEYYQKAITLDQNYALAWCRLARYYNVMGFLGFTSPKEAHEQACKAIQKALKLDETLVEAYAVSGILRTREYSWKKAEHDFLRALELDPKSEDIWENYSIFNLVPMNRLDEAVVATQKAIDLDLLSPFHQTMMGIRYYYMRQYDTAIYHYQNALELDPQYYVALSWLNLVYTHKREFDKAILSIQTALKLSMRSSLDLGHLGYTYAMSGKIDEAEKIIVDLKDHLEKKYVMPTSLANIFVGLGKTDEALDWLEKGFVEYDGQMLYLNVEPAYDPLHSHPRYKALLRKMNLET